MSESRKEITPSVQCILWKFNCFLMMKIQGRKNNKAILWLKIDFLNPTLSNSKNAKEERKNNP